MLIKTNFNSTLYSYNSEDCDEKPWLDDGQIKPETYRLDKK